MILSLFISLNLNAQDIDVAGKARIRTMDKVNTADSIVVRLADGTLAVRDKTTLSEAQILSISNDTIYLTNGEFAKLPPDSNAGWTMDADTIFTSKKFVGIGTTTPDANLHISDKSINGVPAIFKINGDGNVSLDGAAKVIIDGRRGSTGSDAGSIEFDIKGNDGAKISSRVGMNNSVVKGANLIFSTSPDSIGLTERMRISNTGDVGIGTSSPSQRLHVNGKVKITEMDKDNNADSFVVRLADGTLGVRDVSTLKELPASPSAGEILYFDGVTWSLLSPGTQNQTLTICNGVPTWDGCSATLSTTSVTSIGGYSATSGGSISNVGSSPITARGVCWSIDINPDINGDHTDEGAGEDAFSSDMIALSENTTYYVRAYVTSAVGTAYGNEVSFTTLPNALATLTTTAITALGAYSATSGGNISDRGGPLVTAVGVCWSTSMNPDINGSHTDEGAGDGEYASEMTSLTGNTMYYVRAYATNAIGTAYGNEVSFTTLPANSATLTTTAITLLGGNSVTTGGNISGLGGTPVTARGVCWSSSVNPTISGNHSVDGSGAGTFQTTITGLGTFTTYHIRAYATNGIGTAYGNDVVITTLIPQ